MHLERKSLLGHLHQPPGRPWPPTALEQVSAPLPGARWPLGASPHRPLLGSWHPNLPEWCLVSRAPQLLVLPFCTVAQSGPAWD